MHGIGAVVLGEQEPASWLLPLVARVAAYGAVIGAAAALAGWWAAFGVGIVAPLVADWVAP